MLVAQWKLDGFLLTAVETGWGVVYMIESKDKVILQDEEAAGEFLNEQIKVWIKEHPDTGDKWSNVVRELGTNFYWNNVIRGVDLIPVEGREGRRIVGEHRWDVSVASVTDGQSLIINTAAPALTKPVDTYPTAARPSAPHRCRFIEKSPSLAND